MSQESIFIAGKHPFRQPGGHSSYVRAHARAARRLGFEPHVFFIGTHEAAGESDLGIIHQNQNKQKWDIGGATCAEARP